MSEASHFRGFDFTGTDWGDANRAIAARIGADESLVAAARRHFGMVVKERYDWTQVDFGQTNAEIAAQLGCPESTVSRARRREGLGRERVDWNAVRWEQPDTVIAAELGVTPQAVGKARRRITGETGRKAGRPKKAEGSERAPVVRLKNLSPDAIEKFRQHAEKSRLSLDDAVCYAVARYLKWLENEEV